MKLEKKSKKGKKSKGKPSNPDHATEVYGVMPNKKHMRQKKGC